MLKFRISAQVQVTAPTLDIAAKKVKGALSLISRRRAKVGALALCSVEPDDKDRPVGLLDIKPCIWWSGGPFNEGCYLTKVSINFSTRKIRGTVLVDGHPKSWYFAMDDPNIEFRGFSR